MALPALDAVFASAADVPRRYMLAQWLANELVEIQAPSNVLVSGAGSSLINGIYIEAGIVGGKRSYDLQSGGYVIVWSNPNWVIRTASGGIVIYTSSNNVEFPWQVTTWNTGVGSEPVPTVTEVPAANPISNYVALPERYLWAKIAVAAGAPLDEASYISLPKQYVWKAIYDAVSGSSLGTIDWTEKQALGHIAAAYRGDTGTPENLATYIDWPWRYQVASIVTHLGIDADALSYIQRVETADGASLESGVRLAIDNFVRGCKTDGIWDAIKSSTILAGARTLSGALQPLVGAAPTNFNFVSGDYNRKTGLVGDGSTKYLDSNRAGNADPQNNFHAFAWLPSQTLVSENISKQLIASIGNTWIGYNALVGGISQYFIRARQGSSSTINFATTNVIGPVGVSRSTSSAITARANGVNNNFSVASATAGIPSFFVLAGNDGSTAIQHSPARLSFYSIGESLDLALLDTRVTNLINAYTAAIP